MRKVITLFLTILLVLSMAGFASAEPANITEALSAANQELSAKYYGIEYFRTQNVQGKPINESNWAKWGVFSYGTPQEASPGKNDFDPGTNRYRYYGYTMNNEKYTNTFFRNDTTEIVDVNSADWIPEPWDKTIVQNFVTNVMREPRLESSNPFNNDPALLQSIIMGIENVTLYNPYIKFKRDSRQWQEYVHILQPPTKYVFGMGRLFRIVDGQMRYLTIPLTPLTLTADPDFSVALEVEEFQNVKPGDKVTSTVTYKLNQDHPGAERAWLRLHHQVGNTEYQVKLEPVNPADQPDANGYVTFQPGESKTYRYTFTVQSSSKKIIARINPVDSTQDKDWSNNRDEADIGVPGYDAMAKIRPLKTEYIIFDPTVSVENTIITGRNDENPGTIPVRLTVTGAGGTKTYNLNIGPKGEKYKRVPYNFTAGPGTYKIRAEAWPPNGEWTDISPENNVAEVTITVKRGNVPKGDSDIRVGL